MTGLDDTPKLLLHVLCPKSDNTSKIQYAKDNTLGKRVAVLGTNEFKYENMGHYYTIPIIGDLLACVDTYMYFDKRNYFILFQRCNPRRITFFWDMIFCPTTLPCWCSG